MHVQNATHPLHAREVSHLIMSHPSLEKVFLEQLDDKKLVSVTINTGAEEATFLDILNDASTTASRAEFEAELPPVAYKALQRLCNGDVVKAEIDHKITAYTCTINMPLHELKEVIGTIKARREQHTSSLTKTRAKKPKQRSSNKRFFFRASVRGGCGAYA